jgi:hypothetical protein
MIKEICRVDDSGGDCSRHSSFFSLSIFFLVMSVLDHTWMCGRQGSQDRHNYVSWEGKT